MHIIIGIIAAIVIFAILVAVHEGGHFFVAKLADVKVNEFSIGMGPLIFKKQRGETTYSLRAFPVGGYVAMEGEEDESDDERAFNNKSALAKILILAAGPFMNFVLAVVVLAGLITYMGTAPTLYISEVAADAPAYEAGLVAGDRITSVNGEAVSDNSELSEALSDAAQRSDTVEVGYVREGSDEEQVADISFMVNNDGEKKIGVSFKVEHNLLDGLVLGAKSSVYVEKEMIKVLGDLFTGNASTDDVVGPVGIVTVVDQTAQAGVVNLIYLLALLSLNLGLVNIIPFPALDGGRILFTIIRALTGKMISDRVEGYIHLAGMIVLFSLMIVITFKDINTFIF